MVLTDKNIGDLLNAKSVTWGWFEGGFREAPGKATCTVSHANKAGVVSNDYIPHHEPFQYYPSTQNLQHLPPSSVDMIGETDQANHQYDLTDFWASVDNGTMPAVSFLKAPAYQDGHAGYSDPLDEQEFVVNTINRLEKTRFWHDTAVVIAYDDSDGWYDHVLGPIVNQSSDPSFDALKNGSTCAGNNSAAVMLGGYQDRCGYGPRLPLLVISPYAKANYVATRSPTRPRFSASSRTTGRPHASATARSTSRRAPCSTCSTSRRPARAMADRAVTSSTSTPRRARSSSGLEGWCGRRSGRATTR